jgi:hypothetical protein
MKRNLLIPALGLGCLLCAPAVVNAQGTIDQSTAGAMNGEHGGGINGQTDPTLFGDPVSHWGGKITITFISRSGAIRRTVLGRTGTADVVPEPAIASPALRQTEFRRTKTARRTAIARENAGE